MVGTDAVDADTEGADSVGEDAMSMTHWFPSRGEKVAVKVTFVLQNLRTSRISEQCCNQVSRLLLEVRPQELPALLKPLETVDMLGSPSLVLSKNEPFENRARVRCQRALAVTPWFPPEQWPRDEVWRQHPSVDATVPPRLPLPLPGCRDVLVLPGVDAAALFHGHVRRIVLPREDVETSILSSSPAQTSNRRRHRHLRRRRCRCLRWPRRHSFTDLDINPKSISK